MTAITLHQLAALTQPKLQKYVINTLVAASPLAERIPYESTDQLTTTAPYTSSLPTPTFRKLNEAGSEISSDFSQVSRSVSIIDNDIKLDPVTDKLKTIVDMRQQQITNASKAFGYFMVDKFVNGDITSDPYEYDGIRRILQEDVRFNGQVINATANATEQSLLPGSASDANYLGFLHKLDLVQQLVEPVMKPDQLNNAAWITNSVFMLVVRAALRQLKMYNTTKDQFDRDVFEYGGVPFIDAGFSPAGALAGTLPAGGVASNLVIGNDVESVTTTNGGNAYTNQTPIYLDRFGRDFNMGLQVESLMVKDHGEQTATPHYRIIQLRWVGNPAVFWQKRSIARLVGFSPSGVTS